ncbi:hypothetical protein SeMB42_g02954 [Synchytrium endobioticum]|uniref:Uncharacterized protein n=1 Tax=Synchytrium endobioticum TaxID=286115 RepID=A0A507DCH2_9FUNG|nr:hypothetical protein SeMB42_g02954 [Synchytrium endobioticum]
MDDQVPPVIMTPDPEDPSHQQHELQELHHQATDEDGDVNMDARVDRNRTGTGTESHSPIVEEDPTIPGARNESSSSATTSQPKRRGRPPKSITRTDSNPNDDDRNHTNMTNNTDDEGPSSSSVKRKSSVSAGSGKNRAKEDFYRAQIEKLQQPITTDGALAVENGAAKISTKASIPPSPNYSALTSPTRDHSNIIAGKVNDGVPPTPLRSNSTMPPAPSASSSSKNNAIGGLKPSSTTKTQAVSPPPSSRTPSEQASHRDPKAGIRIGSRVITYATINSIDRAGRTPIFTPAAKGDLEACTALINAGADVNAKDNAGWSPLHEACLKGHDKVVSLLIRYGADPNAPGGDGDTPLHDAVENGHSSVVNILLAHGASLTTANSKGALPRDLVDDDDQIATVLDSWEEWLPRIADKDQFGRSILHKAAEAGDMTLFKNCLKYGCDVAATDYAGNAPIHDAVSEGRKEITSELLRYGASPNSSTRLGDTPLHVAVRVAHPEIVELLLKYGASPTTANGAGKTPRDLVDSQSADESQWQAMQNVKQLLCRDAELWKPYIKPQFRSQIVVEHQAVRSGSSGQSMDVDPTCIGGVGKDRTEQKVSTHRRHSRRPSITSESSGSIAQSNANGSSVSGYNQNNYFAWGGLDRREGPFESTREERKFQQLLQQIARMNGENGAEAKAVSNHSLIPSKHRRKSSLVGDDAASSPDEKGRSEGAGRATDRERVEKKKVKTKKRVEKSRKSRKRIESSASHCSSSASSGSGSDSASHFDSSESGGDSSSSGGEERGRRSCSPKDSKRDKSPKKKQQQQQQVLSKPAKHSTSYNDKNTGKVASSKSSEPKHVKVVESFKSELKSKGERSSEFKPERTITAEKPCTLSKGFKRRERSQSPESGDKGKKTKAVPAADKVSKKAKRGRSASPGPSRATVDKRRKIDDDGNARKASPAQSHESITTDIDMKELFGEDEDEVSTVHNKKTANSSVISKSTIKPSRPTPPPIGIPSAHMSSTSVIAEAPSAVNPVAEETPVLKKKPKNKPWLGIGFSGYQKADRPPAAPRAASVASKPLVASLGNGVHAPVSSGTSTSSAITTTPVSTGSTTSASKNNINSVVTREESQTSRAPLNCPEAFFRRPTSSEVDATAVEEYERNLCLPFYSITLPDTPNVRYMVDFQVGLFLGLRSGREVTNKYMSLSKRVATSAEKSQLEVSPVGEAILTCKLLQGGNSKWLKTVDTKTGGRGLKLDNVDVQLLKEEEVASVLIEANALPGSEKHKWGAWVSSLDLKSFTEGMPHAVTPRVSHPGHSSRPKLDKSCQDKGGPLVTPI